MHTNAIIFPQANPSQVLQLLSRYPAPGQEAVFLEKL
jgi:hypothetical protein